MRLQQFRSKLSLLLAVVVLIATMFQGAGLWSPQSVSAAEANLIVNGGFETGDLTGWDTSGNAKFIVTDAERHEGTYSLEVGGPQNWNGIKYSVDVIPNTDYTLSFYGKGAGGAAYKVLGGSDESTITENYTGEKAEWSEYRVTFNSGSNASVKLYVSDAGGKAYYDDFVLTGSDAQPAEPGNNLVNNGGLETGDLTGWNASVPSKFSVTDTVYHSGQHALAITSANQDYEGIKNTVQVEPAGDYTFSFYMKGGGGSYFKVLAGSGEAALAEAQTTASSDWKKYSLSFNSGSQSAVIIYVSDLTGDAYFDDFTITKPYAPGTPQAQQVALSGEAKVTGTLTGTYEYSHPSGVSEGYSIYSWLQSDSPDGEFTQIKDSYSETTFVLTDEQIGKYIKFQVTPLDSEGVLGMAAESNVTGPVSAASSGDELLYQISLADKIRSESVEGNDIGQYPAEAFSAFNQAISEAKAVAADPLSDNSTIAASKSKLSSAMTEFDLARVTKPSVFTHFITKSGDKLMDGEQEFRFNSYNYPGALFNEDEAGGIMPTAFEQEDAIRSIKQMGGKVFRTYSLSFKKGDQAPGTVRHIMGPGVLNEEAFKSMDKLLELANKHGLRVIIPFIDHWDWAVGGVSDLAAFRGITDKDAKNKAFYSNPLLLSDYKLIMDKVLNRINTYTGVRYKDDPAILAWESGNELMVSPVVEAESAAHYKKINQNQLFMDGNLIVYPDPNSSSHTYKNITDTALNDPNIDIVTSHYYSGNFATRVREDQALSKGKKPFVVGEFGLIQTGQVEAMLDEVINSGASGALIWSLRPHSNNGGFIQHSEYDPGDGILYRAYHWPGLPSGDYQDERNLMSLMREKAYAIDGINTPMLPAPEPAPELFETSSVSKLRWKGSTGASSYTVERSETPGGPWSVIGKNILDDVNPGENMFSDLTGVTGTDYYYRVKGDNISGGSDYSNIVGPVTAHYVLEDTSADNNQQYYSDNESVVYRTPSSILTFDVTVSGGEFEFLLSQDGIQYSKVSPEKNGNTYHYSGNADYTTYLKIRYPDGNKSLGQVTKVSIHFEGDGRKLTPVHPLLSDGVITDELEDAAYMALYSNNVGFEQGDAELAGMDASRLIRVGEDEAFIQYRSTGSMNSVKLESYQPAEPGPSQQFTFYGSEDGKTFARIEASIRSLGGNWYKTNYEITDMPAGVKFLKIVYPPVFSSESSFPQIGRIQIGVGNGSVSFPSAAPASIIDNGEYYGGESLLVNRAYTADAAGGGISIELHAGEKNGGDYGLKLNFSMGSTSYASIVKDLIKADRTAYDTLQFWVKPDGHVRPLVVKLTTANGETWEREISLSGSKATYVNLPLTNLNMQDIESFGLMVKQGEGPADGAIYLDDIRFIQTRSIDNFDGYANIDEFTAKYSNTRPAGKLTPSLDPDVKNEGAYGLKLSYDLNPDGYAGVVTDLPHVNWTDYDGVKMWIQPNSSKLSFTVQVQLGSKAYMEHSVILDGSTEGQYVKFPFADFDYPSWYGGSGVLDPEDIIQFNLYINKLSDTPVNSGSLYVDQIELYKNAVSVTGVTLDKTELELTVGQTRKLTATVLPVDASNKELTWTSSDTDIVSVNDAGSITAKKEGTATITVTTVDGRFTAVAAVTVHKPAGTAEPSPVPSATPSPTPSPTSAPGGSVSTVPTTSPSQTVTVEGGTLTVVPVVNREGKATVTLGASDLMKLLEQNSGGAANITIKPAEGTDAVILNVPAQPLVSGNKDVDLNIDTGLATVTLRSSLIREQAAGSSDLTLSVTRLNPDQLPADLRSRLGNRPVYEFSLSADGNKIGEFRDNQVQVSIPYAIAASEKPSQVVVYFITEQGQLEVVKKGEFTAVSDSVIFNPVHFSQYAAAYAGVAFNDLDRSPWAVDSIEGLAARGIIQGVGGERFEPGAPVTRGAFVQMLMNTLDYTDTANRTFTDVKSTDWYAQAVFKAHKLGIVKGKMDGTFGANDKITREEMAVMIYRAAEALDVQMSSKDTAGFKDELSISAYAKEAVHAVRRSGILQGMTDGTFMPKQVASRAQAAVVIFKLLEQL
ncbi:hypothetical protein PAECIP111892_03046 [Paenibacillus auburnensis]|uniref:mannan endo-1,4-beta-mannosidase n=1 Tax=Paenibacillus auburnensis TaxID=2905649 RepID=A0ABM9CCF0_9BACL|nr:S-layer homology domain-containing protein [Paenibacillus auburnensis]CAH1208081.1 hypothetical protein PAECIP111892_03046 [Paenibacillus auburnensis]